MTHTFLTNTPSVIYSQDGNRIESRIYITLEMACMTKLSISNHHTQVFTVTWTVTATCFSLIQATILLFTITQRKKHENSKVSCRSNDNDFVKKKVIAKMFTFQRNPLQSSSLSKQLTAGGSPSMPGSIAGSLLL
jgi:hypothetical protein